ncbi:MAG: hypothetical protein RL326_2169 [Pseudomonadota bacterium]
MRFRVSGAPAEKSRGLWSSFAALAVALCMALWSCPVWAMPVERFNSAVDIDCESPSQCSAVARSEFTLGRYTGISVQKRGAGTASVTVEKNEGALRFEIREASPVVLTLSWDGDQHPDQLSGAGLNCLDLTQGGAYAFIVSGISIESECQGESEGQRCPNFQIESRIYDARDPTGQRYSVSTMTRSLPEKTDLVIPFSNFIREGPRGKGNIACVGAVSISFRFEEFESVELEMGSIYTNGAEGMTPLPTQTAAWTQTPIATVAIETSPTPLPTPLASPGSPLPVETALPTPDIKDTPLVAEVSTPAPFVSTPVTARVPAPTEADEVTYGQLVE